MEKRQNTFKHFYDVQPKQISYYEFIKRKQKPQTNNTLTTLLNLTSITGTCIKLTEKGIRCKWDDLPVELATTLLYKNYGDFWEKVGE